MTKKKRAIQPEAIAQQALFDLIERDAEPLIQQWVKDYLATHNRDPSTREVNKVTDEIIQTLTSDKARYHFSNLKPVFNLDGRTWRLEHVQGRS